MSPQGFGAVVVLRGAGGANTRAVNIPWVEAEERYKGSAVFSGRNLGEFSVRQLQTGTIHLALPANGQEILELGPVDSPAPVSGHLGASLHN